MLKYASAAAKLGGPNSTWGEALTAARGGDLSPLLESGYTPPAILLGREDLLDYGYEPEFLSEGQEEPDPYISMCEAGIKRILNDRTALAEYGSKEGVRKCLTDQLRSYADQFFGKGQNAQAETNGRWNGGLRLVGAFLQNGLANRMPAPTKVPVLYIRPSPSALIQMADPSVESGNTTSIIPDMSVSSESSPDRNSASSALSNMPPSNKIMCVRPARLLSKCSGT